MERSDGSTAFMQTPVAEGSSAPPKKSTNQILTTHHTATHTAVSGAGARATSLTGPGDDSWGAH